MLHVTAPAPDLDDVIECGIVVQQASPLPVSRFPAMPRAMITMTPREDGTPSVAFHALSTRPMVHAHGGPFKALGLVLPPPTAARLMGPSTGALVDVVVPWADVAGSAEAARLEEELHRAATDALRLHALQGGLRRLLGRGPERVQRGRALALQGLCGAVGLHGLRASSLLGVGERQVERRCRALLGLSPKQLQRLTRFHGVLAGALRSQRVPDADTALGAGYYDQSHLAREALQLAGAPLRELLRDAHPGGAWWPLATQRLQGARPR